MVNGKLGKIFLQKMRSFQSKANASFAPELLSLNSMTSVKPKPKPQLPVESNIVSIYRVPTNMRQVETRAYDPNIVSIGPYHKGAARLQAMEEIKRKALHRLFDPNGELGFTLETLCDAMKSSEGKARACYSETINLGSDEFVETVVIDGCFILELFRKSVKQGSTYDDPVFAAPWMLPLLRRDLIMLENQIPMFVLSRLFDLVRYPGNPMTTSSLTDLALKFFNPLMPRDQVSLNESIARTRDLGGEHLLGLFRSSLLPRSIAIRGRQPHVFRSIKELQEAGVKLDKRENHGNLDISFMKGVLKIPPLLMEDYTGTLLRNTVAFEQCHPSCVPDFTSYLFFIDGLINTAEDVGLLQYAGVIQHSLGSHEELADLFNKLCREVARDVDESYLYSLSRDLNEYCNQNFNKWRAELVHKYFSSPWALISLISAILFLILSLVQTLIAIRTYTKVQSREKKFM